MNVLWYWPHPHRTENEVIAATVEHGERATVLALATFRDEELPATDARYEVRRVLPDVSRRRLARGVRVLDRVRVLSTRLWRRHRAARHGRFDVVHIELLTPYLDAVAIPLLRRRAAIVLNVHDVLPHRGRGWPVVERAALRVAYRAADRLVVFHQVLADRLVSELGVDPGSIEVVPHPLADVDTTTPEPTAPPTVLLFGSLRANKGIPTLLDAIDRVPRGTARFLVVGAGEPELEARVRADAERTPELECTLGFADTETKHRAFAAASVVVLPYDEAFGSQSGVLLDAYAYGVPCVVTDVGAIGPTVRDDGTGWVVPPGDAGALAAALEVACTDDAARHGAVEQVRVARERHRAAAVGPRIAEVHRSALDAWSRRVRSHAVRPRT